MIPSDQHLDTAFLQVVVHINMCTKVFIFKLQRLWWPLNYTSVKHDSVAALQAFLKKDTQTLITLAPVYILTSSTIMERFENLEIVTN